MIKAMVEVWEQVEAKCYNLVQVDGQGEARNHPKKKIKDWYSVYPNLCSYPVQELASFPGSPRWEQG